MRLIILIPDADHVDRYDDWRDQADQIDALLTPSGVAIEYVPWTSAATLDCDLALPLMAWGYHRNVTRWMTQLERWTGQGVPFANPLSVLRWNADKRYLLNFEAQGVAIVPTRYCDAVTSADLAAARAAFGCYDVVVKPPVSAGADDTWLLRSNDMLPHAAQARAMLIQPMMPAITEDGELSLFYLGGELAHSIVKLPTKGDFRVQPQFGGRTQAIDPPLAAIALAQSALSATDDDLLYARIDMVGDGRGDYRLMEIELIEPSLHLERARDGGTAFAAAVIQAGRRRPSVHP